MEQLHSQYQSATSQLEVCMNKVNLLLVKSHQNRQGGIIGNKGNKGNRDIGVGLEKQEYSRRQQREILLKNIKLYLHLVILFFQPNRIESTLQQCNQYKSELEHVQAFIAELQQKKYRRLKGNNNSSNNNNSASEGNDTISNQDTYTNNGNGCQDKRISLGIELQWQHLQKLIKDNAKQINSLRDKLVDQHLYDSFSKMKPLQQKYFKLLENDYQRGIQEKLSMIRGKVDELKKKVKEINKDILAAQQEHQEQMDQISMKKTALQDFRTKNQGLQAEIDTLKEQLQMQGGHRRK